MPRFVSILCNHLIKEDKTEEIEDEEFDTEKEAIEHIQKWIDESQQLFPNIKMTAKAEEIE